MRKKLFLWSVVGILTIALSSCSDKIAQQDNAKKLPEEKSKVQYVDLVKSKHIDLFSLTESDLQQLYVYPSSSFELQKIRSSKQTVKITNGKILENVVHDSSRVVFGDSIRGSIVDVDENNYLLIQFDDALLVKFNEKDSGIFRLWFMPKNDRYYVYNVNKEIEFPNGSVYKLNNSDIILKIEYDKSEQTMDSVFTMEGTNDVKSDVVIEIKEKSVVVPSNQNNQQQNNNTTNPLAPAPTQTTPTQKSKGLKKAVDPN